MLQLFFWNRIRFYHSGGDTTMAAPSHANYQGTYGPAKSLSPEQGLEISGQFQEAISVPHTAGLDAVELRRRWWHISPGVLAVLLWFFPHADPISPTLYGIFMFASFCLAMNIFVRYRKIARQGDTSDRLDAVAGYACSVLSMILCFPADIELALVVLAVLAFGDGSATLVGKLVQGPRLPWNREKSWSGFFAFILIGGTMASLMYWSETCNPEAIFLKPVTTQQILMCGFIPALVAGVVESVRSHINDNIRVGLAAGTTVGLIQWLTLGIS
ncbi:MAG: hypothetical protein R3C11_19670 [Planctomycetaceae bacterium]